MCFLSGVVRKLWRLLIRLVEAGWIQEALSVLGWVRSMLIREALGEAGTGKGGEMPEVQITESL